MSEFAQCAGRGLIGSQITADQIRAISCASLSSGKAEAFAQCFSNVTTASKLNSDQRQILDCGNRGDEFNACAIRVIIGRDTSPVTRAAVDCAVLSQGDLQQFGNCAANKFLNLNLSSEQQIVMQCISSGADQPYFAASCAASRLTAHELTKCIEYGIGGNKGCFGDKNDLVGNKGFVVRNIASLAGGSNSAINSSGQVIGGQNSIFNNPKQVFGGQNSVPNTVLRDVPSPAPIAVGKVGNKRVCIPWC
ncbi:hypothetical protein [Methylobacterium terrae]|uniref:hypothetical protein n=1 Tax=Methylobacterium terrae TaxID=2202827 RepID=UPI0013A53029|nr:hypothetical protein [Methylobacterium terrae]